MTQGVERESGGTNGLEGTGDVATQAAMSPRLWSPIVREEKGRAGENTAHGRSHRAERTSAEVTSETIGTITSAVGVRGGKTAVRTVEERVTGAID